MTILQCFVRSSLARMKLRQLYENHAAVQIQARYVYSPYHIIEIQLLID
jgi:hypothetical protein